MTQNRPIAFFDRQFGAQVQACSYALNPFEELVLPYLSGHVLDLGCGLGNLAVAAARRGCTVHALDASPAGVDDLRCRAEKFHLPIWVELANLEHYPMPGRCDCVCCIGLLMFFAQPTARKRLCDIPGAVRPGGIAAVNVLIEGTTYLDFFEPGRYHLFAETDLATCFKDWEILESRVDSFPAPGDTVKRFSTLIARKPAPQPETGG